jgi:NADPH:quinone reductase-like Zn-dependent oxidoreductase
MVRRIFIPHRGDAGVLEVRSGPPDPLRPDTVRIAVEAAGVNFADVMMRMGLYAGAPPTPFVPGYEVAGTVREVAPGVSARRPELVPGARVMAGTRFGGYTEEIVTPAPKVHLLPEGWSFEEGAAFPVVYHTAWMGLVRMAHVQPGERVLVHGAGGGVGLAATQIATWKGARVFGTCGTAEKASAAEGAGAERVVVRGRDAGEETLRAWAPEGVDVILEPRGGNPMLRGLDLLAPCGRMIVYGMSGGVKGETRNLLRSWWNAAAFLRVNLATLAPRNAGAFALDVLRLWERDELLGEATQDLHLGVEAGALRPVLDVTFPLERAADAHRRLHRRENVGKIVLVTGAGPGTT